MCLTEKEREREEGETECVCVCVCARQHRSNLPRPSPTSAAARRCSMVGYSAGARGAAPGSFGAAAAGAPGAAAFPDVLQVSFTVSGTRLAASYADHSLVVWNVEDTAKVNVDTRAHTHTCARICLCSRASVRGFRISGATCVCVCVCVCVCRSRVCAVCSLTLVLSGTQPSCHPHPPYPMRLWGGRRHRAHLWSHAVRMGV